MRLLCIPLRLKSPTLQHFHFTKNVPLRGIERISSFFYEENLSRANGTQTNAWANVWTEVVFEITQSQEPMRYHCNIKMTQSQHFFCAVIKRIQLTDFAL